MYSAKPWVTSPPAPVVSCRGAASEVSEPSSPETEQTNSSLWRTNATCVPSGDNVASCAACGDGWSAARHTPVACNCPPHHTDNALVRGSAKSRRGDGLALAHAKRVTPRPLSLALSRRSTSSAERPASVADTQAPGARRFVSAREAGSKENSSRRSDPSWLHRHARFSSCADHAHATGCVQPGRGCATTSAKERGDGEGSGGGGGRSSPASPRRARAKPCASARSSSAIFG